MAQLGRSSLKHEWYACLPAAGVARLGSLRHSAGVEVATENSLVWLRGPAIDEATRGVLRAVLGCRIFRPLDDGQLVPDGKSLPHGYVPGGAWTPLADWLTTEPPSSRLPMKSVRTVPLKLVRSRQMEPPQLIRTTRAAWLAYAITAPQVRLDRLTFATSEQHTVVHGTPLPPIQGDYFWLRAGIAAPVGYHWTPAVDAAVLRNRFALDEGDIVLLSVEGHASVICGDRFVGATRSAVRLTEGSGDEQP